MSPGISGTLHAGDLFNSPRSAAPSTGEQRNPTATLSAGGGLGRLMSDTGGVAKDMTGLEVPALIALGVIAWVLFRWY